MRAGTTWVLVPMKDPSHGKSRLGAVLDAGERAELAWRLFGRALDAAAEAGLPAVVMTDSDAVAEAARARGAEVLPDPPGAERLGHVVDAGLAWLAGAGAEAALVLMADLPDVTGDDLRALVARREPLVVAPDAEETGTGALLLRPPDLVETAFGSGESLARHLALGAAVLRRPGLAHDVDLPADLDAEVGGSRA